MEDVFYSITDLAEEFGVTSRTIRFYEDKGLVTPRRDGLTRIYSRSDRARLKLILRGRRLGFSLQDIKKMIDLYDPENDSMEQLKYTKQKCEEQLEKLKVQREDINEAIAELEEGLSDMQEYMARGGAEGGAFVKKLA
ncbi:MerR family transcriptional regulator [Sneathiella chinensis]|uniref:Transcriptional regulator n=1 Tax=Sneathiella chinensis TaxID=349750 RepID=A0ABQ5U1D8_9PROT|nr:MerR family DNA-binding transcriptional regulator [Sneathiella chinensis]GLQ05480.1 transcriptional regulator [Sneathiella chinensis]